MEKIQVNEAFNKIFLKSNNLVRSEPTRLAQCTPYQVPILPTNPALSAGDNLQNLHFRSFQTPPFPVELSR